VSVIFSLRVSPGIRAGSVSGRGLFVYLEYSIAEPNIIVKLL
jgi:hypothetical protein